MRSEYQTSNSKCTLAETLVLCYLERMGDHAIFMSDAINYIVAGKHNMTKQILKGDGVQSHLD